MVTPRMGSSLGGFQDQMARRLTGRLPRQKPDGKWKYTSTATAKARYEVGFQTMGGYIRIQQKKVSHYIVSGFFFKAGVQAVFLFGLEI